MTGVNPGKHNIFGFIDRDPATYKQFIPTSYHMKAKTLWEVLSDAGRRVIVVNVPVTYPPRTVNGILVLQFPDIFNVGFTAQMEEELDQIESGEKKRLDVVRDFYQPFNEAVTKAMDKKEEIRESLQQEHDEKCPKCGREFRFMTSREAKGAGKAHIFVGRAVKKLPELTFVDFDDYEQATSKKKAESLFSGI